VEWPIRETLTGGLLVHDVLALLHLRARDESKNNLRSMTKLKIALVGGVVATGLAASLLVRNRTQEQLEQKSQLERHQAQQMTELTAEQQRLAGLVAQKTNNPEETQASELQRLGAEASGLRKQTNELAARLQEKRQSRALQSGSSQSPQTPEYYEALHKMSAGKGKDGMNLGLALHLYASDHQGQVPTSLDQVASYLRDQHLALSGTNDFEIVFQGAAENLKVPYGSIAVVRERQTWLGPDGKPTRVYCMADGSVQTISSDDNFQAWEAEHIFPTSSSSR
jgi:hypothetical protein